MVTTSGGGARLTATVTGLTETCPIESTILAKIIKSAGGISVKRRKLLLVGVPISTALFHVAVGSSDPRKALPAKSPGRVSVTFTRSEARVILVISAGGGSVMTAI